MIRGTSSLAWMLLTMVPCLARPCGAGHVLPPIALEPELRGFAEQEPKPERDPKRIWTGKKRVDGKLVELPMASAKELRTELAAIQVVIDVDGDVKRAVKELYNLRIRATRAGYAEREAVLVEVALVLSAVLEAQGHKDWALAAASSLLLSRAEDGQFELTAATGEDLRALATAAEDPRLAALRARLEQPAAEKPEGGLQAVEDIVRNALLNRQSNVVQDLGDRALPALEKLIVEDIDGFPPIEVDPLRLLADISSPRCAEFLRAHFDRGGAIWKARVLRLCKNHGLFPGGKTNSTAWLVVVERLLEDPSTAREALSIVRQLVVFDGLTRSMQQSTAKILNGPDAAAAATAITVMFEGRGRPTALPVYEAALSSPNAEIRKFAAERTLEYESSSALLAAFESPDPVVRAATARSLRMHLVASPKYNNGGTDEKQVVPVVSAPQREILARLLRDPDAAVRAEAARSILQLPTPSEDAVYERIAKDPDAQVRATLLGANSVPLEVRAKCALELASDGDAAVLQSFDAFIFRLPSQDGEPIDPRLFPVLRARWRNKALPFGQNANELQQLYKWLAQTGPGTAELLRWSLAGYDSRLSPSVVSGVWGQLRYRGGLSIPRPPAETSLAKAGLDVTPAELAQFFVQAWADDNQLMSDTNRRNVWIGLPDALCNLQDEMSAEFLPIALDRKRPLPMRVAALQVAARGPGEPVAACLLELSRDPGCQAVGGMHYIPGYFAPIGVALRDEVAGKTVAALLESDQVLPSIAASLAYGYATVHPLDANLADRLLRLWFDKAKVHKEATRLALQQVASRPREAQGDWLIRAARDPDLWAYGLPFIGESQDPSYLSLLDELLSGPESSYPAGVTIVIVRQAALDALTRYFSDDAAEIILKTAGSTASAELRGKCFDALETIRKYQQEKGRWQDDRAANEATATAVRDLVAMLDDKSAQVRALAVRGLGALNAVEELPRIVRMLKDPDAGVRDAANEMLQKLGAPPAKKD